MIRWTGLAPWEFEFPFPGSLTSTFLNRLKIMRERLMLASLDEIHNHTVNYAGFVPLGQRDHLVTKCVPYKVL